MKETFSRPLQLINLLNLISSIKYLALDYLLNQKNKISNINPLSKKYLQVSLPNQLKAKKLLKIQLSPPLIKSQRPLSNHRKLK